MNKWGPSWVVSRWRGEWHHAFGRSLFEQRHYRRLVPLLVVLSIGTVLWCGIVLGLGILLGGPRLIWQQAFAQNVVASLLVLPLSLTIGVFVGTLLQKHSLRFQVRHASDRLGDAVGLATFKFIVFLQRDCGIQIDLGGPVNRRLVERARKATQNAFVNSAWTLPLPAAFEHRLEETVESLASCFLHSADLRLAFPRSFDLMERLNALIREIKAGETHSSPSNTTLIVLGYAAEMLDDLK